MRIPYPERISYTWATVAAAALLTVQLLEHTNPLFALLCFVYIILATMAFNLAGGLYRPAGAFICFNAVLTLLIGLTVKAVLGEPANSNLVVPIQVIEVYVLGMFGMLIAAFMENRLRPKHSLIERLFPSDSLRTVYISAAAIGIAFDLYLLTNPVVSPGSLLAILRNSNQLLPFAILVGVISTVRSSNGRRSVTFPIAIMIVFITAEGFLGFSKQGIFTPLFCWALGAGIAHYRLKLGDVVVLAVAGFFLFYIGVPVCQQGKGIMNEGGFKSNVPLVIDMLTHFQKTRADYEATSVEDYGMVNYFDQPEGFFDRLQMISIDDLLVNQADQDGFLGYLPFVQGWENIIPHFIWKNKPAPYFGNLYARRMGIISEDDTMTGVSFSPSADAYMQGGFTGVMVMETFCLIAVFLATSFVGGDLRAHPAAIILVLLEAHIAPEGMIPGLIQLIFYLFVVVEFAIFCSYIAPVVSSALSPRAVRLPNLASAVD